MLYVYRHLTTTQQLTSDRITSFAHECFTGSEFRILIPFPFLAEGGGERGWEGKTTITSLTKYLVRLSTRRLAETLRIE